MKNIVLLFCLMGVFSCAPAQSGEFIALPSKSAGQSSLSLVDQDSIVAESVEVPSDGIVHGACHEYDDGAFLPTASLACYDYYLFGRASRRWKR